MGHDRLMKKLRKVIISVKFKFKYVYVNNNNNKLLNYHKPINNILYTTWSKDKILGYV